MNMMAAGAALAEGQQQQSGGKADGKADGGKSADGQQQQKEGQQQQKQRPTYDPKLYGEPDEHGRPGKVPEKFFDKQTGEINVPALLEENNWRGTKLGKRGEKPPEAYQLTADADFTPPEGLDKDPVYLAAATYAKNELELSQAQWDGLVRMYWASMGSSGQEIMQAEIAALGPQGPQRIAAVNATLAAHLEPADFEALQGAISSAPALTALERLLKDAILPPSTDTNFGADNGDTDEILEQIQLAKDEYGQPKMANAEYARGYRARLKAHLARKNAGRKA